MSDYQYLDSTGVIVPDTSDILTEVEGEYQAALGADLPTGAYTPQGILINAEALTRAEVVRNNAAVANQINPNVSGGVFLAAICALTGFDPPDATHSTVTGVTVTGVAATSIPRLSQAKTAAGDIFETVAVVVLDGSGNGVVDFQSVETGAIPAAVGALNTIVTNVLGWETVTNATAAALGTDALSDAELRTLRNNTLALQGQSLPEAIVSALYDTAGVLSIQFRENITSSTATIDGISLVAKSIWACVDGGTNLDVATSILSAKSGGCNYNGSVTQNVVEPASGQTYAVKFDRPTAVPVGTRVTVKLPNSSVSAADVVAAVLAYAAGLISGSAGFVTGGSVSPFELASAVVTEIPGAYVQKVEVQVIASPGYQTTEIALALNQKATIIAGNIVVVLL